MPRNISYPLFVAASTLAALFPALLMAGHVAADVTLTAIALLFLIHSAAEKNWRWCREPWVQCLILLWFYIIVRAVFTEVPAIALRRAIPFARYFVFAAALAYWLLKDKTTCRRFLIMLTCATLFIALDGMLQRFHGKDIIGHLIKINTTGNLRLTGPFDHEILGIMLAWLYFPVCLKFIIDENGKLQPPQKLLAGIFGSLLLLAAIMLSGERMALLLTLFGWVIAIFLLPMRKSILLGIFGAGLLVLGLMAWANTDILHRQIGSTMDTIEHWSQSPYGLLFASGKQLIMQHPFFGIGVNHFSHTCEGLYAGMQGYDQACNTHPHNIYMEWLIEGGIIGFLLYCAFLIMALRMCFLSWKQNRANPVFIGLFIAFILRIWPIASSTNFFSPWGAPPFWLVLGALLAYSVRGGISDADTVVAI